jgi:hypothetical protein
MGHLKNEKIKVKFVRKRIYIPHCMTDPVINDRQILRIKLKRLVHLSRRPRHRNDREKANYRLLRDHHVFASTMCRRVTLHASHFIPTRQYVYIVIEL